MAKATEAKDYIAATRFSTGGGSWARDPDPDVAVKRCAKITHQDWKHLFKLDGQMLKVALYDVTGRDELIIGDDGIWDKEVRIPLLKTVEVILPGRSR